MVKNDLRSAKTEERYTGPFLIIRRNATGTYTLRDAVGTEFSRAPSQIKLLATNLDAAEVETIIDERRTPDMKFEYLTKWKNRAEPDWIRAADFHDQTPIREFVERNRKNTQSNGAASLDGQETDEPGTEIYGRLKRKGRRYPTRASQKRLQT